MLLFEGQKYCRMLCNTFDLHLAIIGLEKTNFGLFKSGRFSQVLPALTLPRQDDCKTKKDIK